MTILVFIPFFSNAQSEPPTKDKNNLSMAHLLSNGWSVSGHSSTQEWQNNTPTRIVYSFVLQKDGKFVLCWGDYSQGFDNPCRMLNPPKR